MIVINPDGTLDDEGLEISIDAFVIGTTLITLGIIVYTAWKKNLEEERYRMD